MPRTVAGERLAAAALVEAQTKDSGTSSEESTRDYEDSEEVEREEDMGIERRVNRQTDSRDLPEKAGDGADITPTVTGLWLRAKEDFNKTPNAQAAQKTISDMVGKLSAEAKVDDKSIPGKAKQYLEICARERRNC